MPFIHVTHVHITVTFKTAPLDTFSKQKQFICSLIHFHYLRVTWIHNCDLDKIHFPVVVPLFCSPPVYMSKMPHYVNTAAMTFSSTPPRCTYINLLMYHNLIFHICFTLLFYFTENTPSSRIQTCIDIFKSVRYVNWWT